MKEGKLSAFHCFLSHECMRCAGEKPLFSPVKNEVECSAEKPENTPEKSEKTPEKPEKTPEKSGSCTVTALFEKFKRWAVDSNFGIGFYTSVKFGRDLRCLMKKKKNGVDKKRSVGNNIYTVEWSKLEKYLKHSGLFTNNV